VRADGADCKRFQRGGLERPDVQIDSLEALFDLLKTGKLSVPQSGLSTGKHPGSPSRVGEGFWNGFGCHQGSEVRLARKVFDASDHEMKEMSGSISVFMTGDIGAPGPAVDADEFFRLKDRAEHPECRFALVFAGTSHASKSTSSGHWPYDPDSALQ
jgi:hypothetical protein